MRPAACSPSATVHDPAAAGAHREARAHLALPLRSTGQKRVRHPIRQGLLNQFLGAKFAVVGSRDYLGTEAYRCFEGPIHGKDTAEGVSG